MRLVLYAHYNPAGTVGRDVIYCLQCLRKLAHRISFISNSELGPDDQAELEVLCDRVFVRKNEGYDFGMWQDGLRETDLARVTELILINSSIVGPLGKLELLWERADEVRCDFWGLTDNTDLAPHLQSYFMVFRDPVLRSPCFAQFWNSVLPYSDKMQVIRSYEVGLTLWLEQHGFSWRALFPQNAIWKAYDHNEGFRGKLWRRLRRRGRPGPNTTLSCPELLLRAGMPFLKSALLDPGNEYLDPEETLALLETTTLPAEVLSALKTCHAASGGRAARSNS